MASGPWCCTWPATTNGVRPVVLVALGVVVKALDELNNIVVKRDVRDGVDGELGWILGGPDALISERRHDIVKQYSLS